MRMIETHDNWAACPLRPVSFDQERGVDFETVARIGMNIFAPADGPYLSAAPQYQTTAFFGMALACMRDQLFIDPFRHYQIVIFVS